MLIAAAGFAAVYVVPLVKYSGQPARGGFPCGGHPRAHRLVPAAGWWQLSLALAIGRSLAGTPAHRAAPGSWNATPVGAGACVAGRRGCDAGLLPAGG